MRRILTAALVAAGVAATGVGGGSAADAAEPLKIGMLLTLSGPPAVLGKHINDGFQLYVEQQGGKLGGRDVEIIVADDELKPDVAVAKAQGLLEGDEEIGRASGRGSGGKEVIDP